MGLAAGGGAPDHLDAAAVRHVHVEQHHVGLVLLDRRHRLLDAAGLADDLEQRLELGAHARAEQLVVVHDQHARLAHAAPRAPAPPRCRRRARRDAGAAAVALHPPDDRLAHAAAVAGHGAGVEARPAVAHEHLRAPGALSAYTSTVEPPPNLAAFVIASRAAATTAS